MSEADYTRMKFLSKLKVREPFTVEPLDYRPNQCVS